jgi:peptidoglycan/LPS O-acetylase OafA/YrhL
MAAPGALAAPAARLGAVEGVRAVAAVLVVAYHLAPALLSTHPGLFEGDVARWIARLGPFGVSIFFVLSGFLLYRPYAHAAIERRARPRVGAYYVRRFVRIFPAYWLALGVYIATSPGRVVRSRGDVLTFAGLVQNYRGGYLLRGLGVAWTLVIEVSFYLVLPALALLIAGRRVRSPRAAVTRQLVVLGGLALVGVATRVWALWIAPPGHFRAGAFEPWRAPHAWLPGYLDWFALGMALAVGAAWAAAGGRLPTPVRWLARHTGVAWILGVGAYTAVALHATFPAPGLASPKETQLLVTTVFPLAAAFVVLPVALDPGGGGALRRVLGSVPLVAVGAVSYGIYLWHLIVIVWTQDWIFNGVIPRSAAEQATLVLTITGTVATLSYLLVERPLMRWSARLSHRRRLVPVPSTAA